MFLKHFFGLKIFLFFLVDNLKVIKNCNYTVSILSICIYIHKTLCMSYLKLVTVFTLTVFFRLASMHTFEGQLKMYNWHNVRNYTNKS